MCTALWQNTSFALACQELMIVPQAIYVAVVKRAEVFGRFKLSRNINMRCIGHLLAEMKINKLPRIRQFSISGIQSCYRQAVDQDSVAIITAPEFLSEISACINDQ